MTKQAHPPHTLERQRAVLDLPLNRHLGIVFDGMVGDSATAHFYGTPALATFGDQVHGGALTSLCEVIGFLALAPQLTDDQHAVTHDLHMSFMRAVPVGVRCDLSARVVRSGRTLAFIDVHAQAEGKVVASARITKSIITKNN